MDTKTNRAIGVFDSGVGGLTVVRALMERLPFENIVYFGAFQDRNMICFKELRIEPVG